MQIDKDELLNQAKELLKDEVTQIAFQTWFSSMEITEMTENNIVLKASSQYGKEMLETRYADLVLNTFKFITNKDWTFSVICDENGKKVEGGEVSSSNTSIDSQDGDIEISNKTLNPKYTFETFVVGNNNRFAHAAAIAVGDKPGESYNPLFLYGGVGLGKTHLMQAIGNRILQNNRSAKILYVTSEKFTNQLINAIKDNKNEVFRNKYRTIDVLLIDDIQFIAGKERVQEEFFHTFNALYEDKKQIIISSDKPPREIQFLEDRLKSRFEWGLLADISCPDYETRLAILRKKAQEEKIVVDDNILANIANKIDSNIRELEGVFNKIIATASLTHTPITIELAENTINEFKAASDAFFMMTDDGSYGKKGLVTDALRELLENGEQYDEVIAIGPLVMMKFVCKLTKEYNIKTIVSMNPIMIDGTGMCGCCRLTVGGKVKFACVDGPDFDGHEVDFDESIERAKMYQPFERKAHEEVCNLFKKEVH